MEPLSLREMEALARRALDPAVYDFYAGGADDEATVRANEAAYQRIQLLPRVLRGIGERRLHTELVGSRSSMPVLLAPTAFHRLAHAEGELATARAAAKAGTIMIVSMASTVAIEEVALAAQATPRPPDERHAKTAPPAGSVWFQLYLQPDLGFTRSLIERAEAAGCSAIVLTVDSPVFGRRERDIRNAFHDLPPGLSCPNMAGRAIAFWSDASWEHLDWLRSATDLPLVIKGITHPDDATLAVSHGADAVLVSNHGGRQLDTVPASIDLLPRISDALAGAVPLLVDGGIRRGTDVVKAIALGARAVAIGRPILWGLATDGEEGVQRVLDLLKAELERALALCGCAAPDEVSRDLISALEESCLR